MSKRSILVSIITTALALVMACGGGGGDSDNYTPSVYVAGSIGKDGGGTVACYWKDGERTDLEV